MYTSEDKTYYITINVKNESVTKEIYIAYRNEQAKERMQRIRRSKCMVPNGKGEMRLCNKPSCEGCQFKKIGYVLSLDQLHDDYDYDAADPKEDVIEYINKEEKILAVRKAVSELNEFDRTIAIMVLSEDKSEAEVGKKLGISQSAVHQRKVKIITILQEKLKDFK